MNSTNVSPEATDIINAELLDEMQAYDTLPSRLRRKLATANHNYSVKQSFDAYRNYRLQFLMGGSGKEEADRMAIQRVVNNLNYSDHMIAQEAQLPRGK